MSSGETAYANILLVESDPVVSNPLREWFDTRGYRCLCVQTAEEALKQLGCIGIDLVVTSMYLRDADAISFCRRVRKSYETRILVLSERQDVGEEIGCLDTGADDYLAGDRVFRVLHARVRALLRRSDQAQSSRRVRKVGDLLIHSDTFQVFQNGTPLSFTPTEFKILRLLATRPSDVFSREQILSKVWKTEYCGDERVVDTHVRNLRRKLRKCDSVVRISCLRGVGYHISTSLKRSQKESVDLSE